MALAMHTPILPERGFGSPATDVELIEEQPITSAASIRIADTFIGIGSVCAGRFARRGHDVVLVASDRARKEWATNAED
jgi:hypothetical protein